VTGKTAGQNINVDDAATALFINGVVGSSDQKARAQELASQVSGINKVVNNLQVQKK
jgi:osmotically-inducible protein OsmY